MSNKKSRLGLAALSLVAASALIVGCAADQPSPASTDSGAPAEESQVTTLTVGVTPIANAATLYIALEQGFFEEQGLEVTPTIIQTASTAIPSLLNDELQAALMTSVPVITAASKQLPIRVAAASDRYPTDGAMDTTALVVAPGSGVAQVADLAGKTIAVVGLKSAPELALRVVLEDAGVAADEVEIVEISYPDMVGALEQNRVDAAFLVDPFLSQARAAGMSTIVQPFTDGLGTMSALLWVMSDEFVQQNPATAEKFAAAMANAGEYANANPEAVRGVLGEFTTLSEAAIANSVIPEWDSQIALSDLQAYVDLMTREGFIDAGYDPSGLLWESSNR